MFTREDRKPRGRPTPEVIGAAHHIAFTVSRAVYTQVTARLDERGISHSGEVDRGFMYSIYFRDPLGFLIELACYKFEPPAGTSHAEVLLEAHLQRQARGDHHIVDEHLADAIEAMTRRAARSLSEDRGPRDPYRRDEDKA